MTSDHITELCLTHTSNLFEVSIGIDCIDKCINKLHFLSYSKLILYKFNSLGYRDYEWPDDIKQKQWCIGDSFTLGLGQPDNECWPQLVSALLNSPIINVSMNGASNDWIARRAKYIIDHFDPSVILIQWSYIHRRESTEPLTCDEDRAIWYGNNHDDLGNLFKNVVSVNHKTAIIVHSFIPQFCRAEDADIIYNFFNKHNLLFFPFISHLDYARDGHHYDVLTASEYANNYLRCIRTR